MLNAVLREFKKISEVYKQKISLDNMVNIDTGLSNIEFYANDNYTPDQDKHIINETTKHINMLLKEQYTQESYAELLALISAELRGGMIFIAQLLEDAQFLREWEERNKFRPYFSLSLDDTLEKHSFLFKLFDENPLYLLRTEDLKEINIVSIDKEIQTKIEELKKINETVSIKIIEEKKQEVINVEEYKKKLLTLQPEKEHTVYDRTRNYNIFKIKYEELKAHLPDSADLLEEYKIYNDEFIKYITEYKAKINREIEELTINKQNLEGKTELELHKILLSKVLAKHIEEQKHIDILPTFKYDIKKVDDVDEKMLDIFKIVRKLMNPKYDKFDIEHIVSFIITEFNNVLRSKKDYVSIQEYTSRHRGSYIVTEIQRKKKIDAIFSQELKQVRNIEQFKSVFLKIIKQKNYLFVKDIDDFDDEYILRFYDIQGLFNTVYDVIPKIVYGKRNNTIAAKLNCVQLIKKYIYIQPHPYRIPVMNLYTHLEPVKRINYLESLKNKLEQEGYLSNITENNFDKLMEIISHNVPQVKNSRFQASSNKLLLLQLREKGYIDSKGNRSVLNFDRIIEFIEEYTYSEAQIILNDKFLYKVFEELGYIKQKTQTNKLTSLDDLFSLYDLLSINGDYNYDASLLDMLKHPPENLQVVEDDKLYEYKASIEEYNRSNNIDILFRMITKEKQLLLGDRMTLLKYYAEKNRHIYYNIYPVTRQPSNISGLLIKLFAHNNTHGHNKYPIRIVFKEKSKFLYSNTFYTNALESYTFIGVMCINIKDKIKYILIYKKIFDLTQLPEYKFATPSEKRYDLLTFVDPSLWHLISINSAIYRLKNYDNPLNVDVQNGEVKTIDIYYLKEEANVYYFHKDRTIPGSGYISKTQLKNDEGKKLENIELFNYSLTDGLSLRPRQNGGYYAEYITVKNDYTQIYNMYTQ